VGYTCPTTVSRFRWSGYGHQYSQRWFAITQTGSSLEVKSTHFDIVGWGAFKITCTKGQTSAPLPYPSYVQVASTSAGCTSAKIVNKAVKGCLYTGKCTSLHCELACTATPDCNYFETYTLLPWPRNPYCNMFKECDFKDKSFPRTEDSMGKSLGVNPQKTYGLFRKVYKAV